MNTELIDDAIAAIDRAIIAHQAPKPHRIYIKWLPTATASMRIESLKMTSSMGYRTDLNTITKEGLVQYNATDYWFDNLECEIQGVATVTVLGDVE